MKHPGQRTWCYSVGGGDTYHHCIVDKAVHYKLSGDKNPASGSICSIFTVEYATYRSWGWNLVTIKLIVDGFVHDSSGDMCYLQQGNSVYVVLENFIARRSAVWPGTLCTLTSSPGEVIAISGDTITGEVIGVSGDNLIGEYDLLSISIKRCEQGLNEQVLPHFMVPEMGQAIFQQDGAPPHFANPVKRVLNDNLHDHWIAINGAPETHQQSKTHLTQDGILMRPRSKEL
ncbi:hypothetical protein J6590_046856 [Homalodisca vitripennis]|nr:hypothetical protein J6590_046856 [Homalodisca vitripennis]